MSHAPRWAASPEGVRHVAEDAASRRRRRLATLRRAAPWIVFVLFFPLALFGLIISPNEYESWGGSGVDCDSPAAILFLAFPAAVAYALVAIVFIRRAIRRRGWVPGVAALVCVALVALLARNIRAANAEGADPVNQEVCAGRSVPAPAPANR
jgi:hypothetical protein